MQQSNNVLSYSKAKYPKLSGALPPGLHREGLTAPPTTSCTMGFLLTMLIKKLAPPTPSPPKKKKKIAGYGTDILPGLQIKFAPSVTFTLPKNYLLESQVQCKIVASDRYEERICNFWVQNSPFAQMRFFRKFVNEFFSFMPIYMPKIKFRY